MQVNVALENYKQAKKILSPYKDKSLNDRISNAVLDFHIQKKINEELLSGLVFEAEDNDFYCKDLALLICYSMSLQFIDYVKEYLSRNKADDETRYIYAEVLINLKDYKKAKRLLLDMRAEKKIIID